MHVEVEMSGYGQAPLKIVPVGPPALLQQFVLVLCFVWR